VPLAANAADSNDLTLNEAATNDAAAGNMLGSSGATDNINIDDDNVPLAAGDEESSADQMDPASQMTGIDDQQTPLAGQACGTCKCDRIYWWWVLALIGAITGRTAWEQKNLYDEQKEEEKERKAKERESRYRNSYKDDDLEDF
jgi:hypothetical protein